MQMALEKRSIAKNETAIQKEHAQRQQGKRQQGARQNPRGDNSHLLFVHLNITLSAPNSPHMEWSEVQYLHGLCGSWSVLLACADTLEA